MYLEIQLIINRQLHDDNIIDIATYENARNYLLKEIQKEKTHQNQDERKS